MTLIEISGKGPRLGADCFVAENATLAGSVTLSEGCSVWFGATLRAEFEIISLGSRSNVQDNCTVHTDEGFPCKIGENVSIGHGAIVHGATIGSNCLLGMGAILLNGSTIGDNSIVGAGSLLLQGSEFPERFLILGSPAKAARQLTDKEIEKITLNAAHYYDFRAIYLSGKLKPGGQVS
jgi:carbonic anhydrase/acetyltransferase-like protein (isoleucine patch superfamily)